MAKERRVVRVVHGEPRVRIGKSGIHDGVVQEIERWLKEEGIVKVRVMKSYLRSTGASTEQIASEVAKLTKASLVTVRGHVFVLRRSVTRRGSRR